MAQLFYVECDSVRCASRHDADGPTVVKFDELKVKNDPEAIPDNFFRLIRLQVDPSDPAQFIFCCGQCVKDFIAYSYVEPLSPREKALRAAQESAAVKAQFEQVRQGG